MESLPRDDVRLHMVSGALRRHAVLIAILLIAGASGGGAFASSHQASYAATASVMLRATSGNTLSPATSSSGPEVTIAMGTETGVVRSPSVAAIASKILGTTVQPQSPDIAVSSPPNTVIVQIQYTADSAKKAQAGAQAVAQAFLEYRQQRSESARKFQVDILTAQAKVASADLAKASAAAVATKAPPEAGQQVQLHATQLATLRDNLSSLAATDTTPGTIIAPALLPTGPSGLSPLILVLAGALLGLAVGIVLAIWRELRDDRVRGSVEATIVGLPVLANIRRSRDNADSGPAPLSNPGLADAYRQARAGVQAGMHSPCSLTVSDLSGFRHAGEVATSLGLSLASANHRVTLVAAAPYGDVESLMSINDGPGLAEALATGHAPAALLREAHSVRVLASGSGGSDMRDLVAGERFADVLASLKAESDFVVVAAGPAMSAEGASVALATDAMILVVEDRRTTHAEVGRTLHRLSLLNVKVVGAICVPAGKRRLFSRRGRTTTTRPKGQPVGSGATTTTEASADDVLIGMPITAARIVPVTEEPRG